MQYSSEIMSATFSIDFIYIKKSFVPVCHNIIESLWKPDCHFRRNEPTTHHNDHNQSSRQKYVSLNQNHDSLFYGF